jgi:hypothetical protein
MDTEVKILKKEIDELKAQIAFLIKICKNIEIKINPMYNQFEIEEKERKQRHQEEINLTYWFNKNN